MRSLPAYIDPGTGSMLFTILIGILGTGAWLLRDVFNKMKVSLSRDAKSRAAQEAAAPFVIFSDSKRYWNQFGPICAEFEKRQIPLEYLTMSPDDPALSAKFQFVKCRFIGEGNKAFSVLNYLKADVLLATTPGLDVYQWKRSKGVKYYAHICHMASDPSTYRMFGLDYYDAVLLSGEYQARQIRQLEEKRKLPAKELAFVGVPYLDAMLERLQTAEPLPPHPLTVLVAPSWGPSSLLGHFGGRIIRALLETGYHIVVRPHPQSFTAEKEMLEKLMKEFPESEQLEWNRDNDNFEILRRADVMISDFSGVILDYALVFQKPVIYADTDFDRAPYDAAWLEEELWTFQVLPRIGHVLKEEDLEKIGPLIREVTQLPS